MLINVSIRQKAFFFVIYPTPSSINLESYICLGKEAFSTIFFPMDAGTIKDFFASLCLSYLEHRLWV